MVIDFLREYQEELIAEKIEIKEELDLLDTRLLEDYKFVDILLTNDRSFFNEFSPRDLNAKNKEKASEVKESINRQEEEKKILEERMRKIDGKLSQIKSYIDEEIENRKKLKDSSIPENLAARITDDIKELDDADAYDDEDIEEDFVNEYKIDSATVISRLNSIKSYIKVDPNRAEMDIDSLIKLLNV